MTSYRNIALAFISAALSLGFKDEPAGERFHIVQEGESLVDVSILNYGTPTRVNQIREWNHLKSDSVLQINQKLYLLGETIPPAVGHQKLIEFYRRWLTKRGPERDGAVALSEKLVVQPEAIVETQISAQFEAMVLSLKMQLKEEVVDSETDDDDILYKDEYIPKKSSAIVKREEEKVESTAADLFLEGKRHFERGNLEKAIQSFGASLKKDPDQMPVCLFQIRTLMQLKKNEDAKRLAVDFISKHPELENIPFLKSAVGGTK